MCGHPQVRAPLLHHYGSTLVRRTPEVLAFMGSCSAAVLEDLQPQMIVFSLCGGSSQFGSFHSLQELIKLRNLEHPGDPVQSLLLDMDFRSVVEPCSPPSGLLVDPRADGCCHRKPTTG